MRSEKQLLLLALIGIGVLPKQNLADRLQQSKMEAPQGSTSECNNSDVCGNVAVKTSTMLQRVDVPRNAALLEIEEKTDDNATQQPVCLGSPNSVGAEGCGNLLDPPVQIKTLEQCQDACLSDKLCQHIVHDPTTDKCQVCSKSGQTVKSDSRRTLYVRSCFEAPAATAGSAGNWTVDEVEATKVKLFKMFENKHFRPGTLLRLSFHDCIPYKDGSGGCDGCLDWRGVDEDRFFDGEGGKAKSKKKLPPLEDGDGGNNALGDVVRSLEDLYTNDLNDDFPYSLQGSGKSRADLWALAGIAAVEFTIQVNNNVCNQGRFGAPFSMRPQCLAQQGEADCEAVPSRSLIFKAGRKDCVTNLLPSYKTDRHEDHPHSHMNGKAFVQYMKRVFGFTGRETVAIMGAHTIGKFHKAKTGFKYTWTSKNFNSFNNEYYRNLILEPMWHFEHGSCPEWGTPYGDKPKAKWFVKANRHDTVGGPIQWVKFNHIGPLCRESKTGWPKATREQCCTNVPEGMQSNADNDRSDDSIEADDNVYGGCEMFRFINSEGHFYIQADMGLYLDFEVDDDGYPQNCSGLEDFNSYNVVKRKRQGVEVRGKKEAGKFAEQDCPLQEYAEPSTSEPLHKIVEEFAAHQTVWLDAYMPAMEKYLERGYDAGELQEPM